jgi:anti-sigma B factor antagonist
VAFLLAAAFSHERRLDEGMVVQREGGRTVEELLSLTIETQSDGCTVRLTGEIDLETAPGLRQRIGELPGDLTLDLTHVTFVNSQAIAVLIAEHKRRVAAGRRLVVTGASPMALQIFEVTGVDQVLDLDGDSSRH